MCIRDSVPPTATPTAAPTATPVPHDSGVPSTVCPSGHRAALERAQLRYVGTDTGWNRLHNLVDEQEEPWYFLAWEPGYPGEVTVEVVLDQPVLATDIRVAQDPYTVTSGTIEIVAADQQINLRLSGTNGWRTHTFDQPVELDRLTISRSQAETNIVELMVCVRP